ncbi:MAG: VWA domain-containing protein [Acidobacteria bacterium]|nr:VWA domain-containing protein [Acidobacteriota bacterium]
MAPTAWTARLALTIGALAALRPVGAQEFRSGVELRVLDVVVTDAHGLPARGLTPEDFEITEDGTPVTIRFVTPAATPAMVPADSGVAAMRDPDVWTNVGVASRRVFAVVLDDLSTRPSDTARARAVAQAFVERLPEGDLAAIVFTGQQAGTQEFTADKARLTQSLRQYTGRYAVPDLHGVDTDDDHTSMDMLARATLGGEVTANYRRTLQTLVNVTEWLSSIHDRRKSILFVTAGLEPALAHAMLSGLEGRRFSGGRTPGDLFATLVARAAETNVAIYPLDYQGLSGPLSRSLFRTGASGLNALRAMADETGGVAGVNNNNPDRLFDRMIQDASDYYLVAYEPAASAGQVKRARAHPLRVRMRSDALSVRARRTYVSRPAASAANRKQTAAQLLSSPLPGGALALHVQVSAFPKGNGQARVFAVLEVVGDELGKGVANSDTTVEVTYRLAATDVQGRVQASDARDVALRLSRERFQQITRQRLRIFSRLDLPPGAFRVRASVVHGDTHGVVAGDVEVPDYKKASLVVSQPLVVSSGAATIPVRREDFEPFQGRLSAAPTALRSFSVGESLEVYAEVHMPTRRGQAHSSDRAPVVKAVVVNASREEVFQVPTRVGPTGKGLAGGLIYPVTVSPSTSGLVAGQYDLALTVMADGLEPVTRRLAFTIR